jgi:acyl carrier protein
MDQFLSEFINEFAQQFDEGLIVPKETIEPTTQFRETVEWDSIGALYIITMMEDVYNVKITGKQLLEDLHTFADLIKLIEVK